ncbi:MAG TPA: glycosyltransferase family 8 protein [Candidatus Avilachnospira avistercoris]|nr:glycosyltransferase family 8 protein [Candidatus Avilachnospira avistercoris]
MAAAVRDTAEAEIKAIGMDIVYNCDEKFIGYAAVSIVSLLENNREEPDIHIHILSNGISSASMERLSAMAASYEAEDRRRSLSFLDIGDMEEMLRQRTGTEVSVGRFSYTALGRIFASELIKEVSRLLYIDSDTLVLGGLSELYGLSLSGCLAAMAIEPTIYSEVKIAAGLSEEEPYFNSGVILMDAEGLRREHMAEKAVSYIRSSSGSFSFADQDILNHVLRGRVKVMPQRFNFFSGYYYRSYESLIRLYPGFSEGGAKEDFKAAKKRPVIVHFAGDERPWIEGNFCPYRRKYRSYKALTPWRDEPDIKGRRAYMLFYHMVNLATAMAPGLRELISKAYYQMKVRKS